jgi:hypothetical protein
MRIPNTECVICNKPLYRRPYEFKDGKEFCCVGCRSELYKRRETSPNLKLGREKGTNHLEGIPKNKTHKEKMKKIMSKWCENNVDKVAERGKKIRGENHYQWKGGTSRLNTSIRTLTENRKWLDNVKLRDKKCVICETTKELESHHIVPLVVLIEKHNITNREQARECKELWNLDNGMTVCAECHCKIHNRKYNPKEKGRRQK